MSHLTTTVRIDDDLNERLRLAMARRKVRTLQAMFEEAMQTWIEGSAKPAPEGFQYVLVRREAAPVVTALLEWLETDGKEKVLAALEQGLTRNQGDSAVLSEKANEQTQPVSRRAHPLSAKPKSS